MIQKSKESQLANYLKMESLGKGSYGHVYKAKNRTTNEYVAIKKMLLDMEAEGFPSTSIREISLLKEIQHKNVICLKDVIVEDKQLYLVFEYLDTDLRAFMANLGKSQFEPIQVKRLLYQLLQGIAECHGKKIIHRDLKPANLLVDNHLNLKIADFGLARTISAPQRAYSQEVVTLWYRAPQILMGLRQYSTPIDIWSIGCIFAQMVIFKPLFPGDNEIDQLFRIFRTLGTPTNQVWPNFTNLRNYSHEIVKYKPCPIQKVVPDLKSLDAQGIDLLNKMLKYDPNARISAKAALFHPYFKDMK